MNKATNVENLFRRVQEQHRGEAAATPQRQRGDGVGCWWTVRGTRQPGKVCRLLSSGGAAIGVSLLGDISVQVDDDQVKQFKRRVLSQPGMAKCPKLFAPFEHAAPSAPVSTARRLGR